MGIELSFARALRKEIAAMHVDIARSIKATWKDNPPIAQDSAADDLRDMISQLATLWGRRFDRLAREIAAHYALAASYRVDATLKAALRRAGFAVEFHLTPAQEEAMTATVAQNVSLIRSIPEQHLKNVEQAVMRSVQTGRDVGGLAKELREVYGVTKRRASFIAQQQNNAATAAITRVRQRELGVKFAIWRHSHAGKEPRPTHLANNGKRYNVETGWFDPAVGRHIMPGELFRCRCSSISIIPEFT